jgi:hypothetical protein
MVQTTFTKQKRELEKAVAWIEKIRAQEVRQRRYTALSSHMQYNNGMQINFYNEAIFSRSERKSSQYLSQREYLS